MKTILASLCLTLAPAAHATLFERSDGVRFDSEVGAACGALSTAVHFEPLEGQVDLHDEPILDHLAECLTHGPLRGVNVAVLGHGDRALTHGVSLSLANERARAVKSYLIERGVPYWQLEVWGVARGDQGEAAHVGFRVIDPTVTIDARPVASR